MKISTIRTGSPALLVQNPQALLGHAPMDSSFQTIVRDRAQDDVGVGRVAGRMDKQLNKTEGSVDTFLASKLPQPM